MENDTESCRLFKGLKKKEYFMILDWDLIWTTLQVVALLIIAREIDKRIRKRKK